MSGMWDLSSLTRGWTPYPALEMQSLNHWTTREVPWPHSIGEEINNERKRNEMSGNIMAFPWMNGGFGGTWLESLTLGLASTSMRSWASCLVKGVLSWAQACCLGAGFLSLGTTDICGGCAVCPGIHSSNPGLCPLQARVPSSLLWQPRMPADISQCALGIKLLLIENHLSKRLGRAKSHRNSSPKTWPYIEMGPCIPSALHPSKVTLIFKAGIHTLCSICVLLMHNVINIYTHFCHSPPHPLATLEGPVTAAGRGVRDMARHRVLRASNRLMDWPI